MMLYAENRGAFASPEQWTIVRGMNNPCIVNFPNPAVVRIENIYLAYTDAGGYGEGWAGRKILEMVSLDGLDWTPLGFIEHDADVQANHVPEAFALTEGGSTWLYLTYGGQVPGDYRYDRIRAKRRRLTPAELESYRTLCNRCASGLLP